MRLLLVDDHPLVRAGARQLLQDRWPEAQIVESASLAEAMTAIGDCAAAVTDLSLPDAHGLEALIKLHRRAPAVPLLVLSMHAEEAYAARALQLGASGYLPKDRAGGELVAAVQRLLAGGRYIGADLADRLADLLTGASPAQPAHATLSTQELRVALLLAQGRSVGDIAETMFLSVKTVSTYRGRALEKLGLANNAELTRYCLAQGLIGL
jgi:DNA-binding NarL/FixJ family response regulator